jgi:hypothetical protein
MVTRPSPEIISKVMDEMLQTRGEDYVVQVRRLLQFFSPPPDAEFPKTYFDNERPRVDPVVCVNVLALFYSQGRGGELAQTLDYVQDVLLHRAYEDGTRYYETAEAFLFFVARLLHVAPDATLRARLEPLLKERVNERTGMAADALALAMRVLACAAVGMQNTVDSRVLRLMQEEDGGWPLCWFYKYASSGVKIGNRGFTTALAVNALKAVEAPLLGSKSPEMCCSRAGSPTLSHMDSLPMSITPPTSLEPTNSQSSSPPNASPDNCRPNHRRRSIISELTKSMITSVLSREGKASRKEKLVPSNDAND